MTEEQIKHMVDRFLSWRLPPDFRPDCGIHFDADAARKLNPSNPLYQPYGTNLFDANQARQMVDYMLVGLPTSERSTEAVAADLLDALEEACERIEALAFFANSHGAMIEDETFPEGLAAIARAKGAA